MDALAVVIQAPGELGLRTVGLVPPSDGDVVVGVEWSGISTGTERLLWSGRMPAFPGMGYPLVPGYETVGRVIDAGAGSALVPGQRVFVPGARCYADVRGLFGGAAARLVVPEERVTPVDEGLGENAVLLALAATAHHAVAGGDTLPELIVGHGVLGRLLARLVQAKGGMPVVWETSDGRRGDALGYSCIHPDSDDRTDYRAIVDVSGDVSGLDALIQRLAPGGEVVLAGFYDQPIRFDFAKAFLKEPRLRIAAEWRQPDLDAVQTLISSGALALGDLITHRLPARDAPEGYRTAFSDASCLKMILDWRGSA
ncbi:MAG: chlorophyll synthesis pathway protein BchC [Geminicoccaceae bacterium]